MKINNVEALSVLLGNKPEVISIISQTIPYISVKDGGSKLILRCLEFDTMKNLLKFSSLLTNRLGRFLGFEICLECEQKTKKAIGESSMVVVEEKSLTTENNSTEDTKFWSLEILGRAINQPTQEVIKLLGEAKEVIHPMSDGSLKIRESAFDTVLLHWAKSFKNGGATGSSDVATAKTKPPKSLNPRNPTSTNKILNSELTIEDIIRVKNGKNANAPNLTEKGIQQTLVLFFSKVKMDDTSQVDAISAFIEGTSEFGQALRKKLITGYKKFTKDPDLQETESRLIEGAKTYLESMAVASAEE